MALLHPSHLTVGDLCRCGQIISRCPFWTQVLGRAIGAHPLSDAHALLSPIFRRRAQARLWWGPLDHPVERTSLLQRFYSAVGEAAAASLVVDSSKHPSYADALLATPSLEVSVLHLVRDPRAVAWSWQRAKRRPEAPGAVMPTLGPGAAARRWLVHNLLVERLAPRASRYLRVRYEDLVADPDAILARISRWAGLAVPATLGRQLPSAPPGHSIAGNPVRFHTTPRPIEHDEAWRTEQSTSHRRQVTLLTAPLLHRYGYETRTTPARDGVSR